ncbi:MAG: chemotaxis protein CheW [Bacteroidales bacterium]
MKKEIRSVLKIRAVAMAKEAEQKRESSATMEIIEFALASEIYGIESAYVREVYPLKDFTPLPGVPSFILGIINVRGQILPVVDLKKFFNLPEKGLGELNKVIILRNENMEFGILADIINGTRVIFEDEILPVPPTVTGIGEKHLRGITKDQLIILSAENLLADKNIVVYDEATM